MEALCATIPTTSPWQQDHVDDIERLFVSLQREYIQMRANGATIALRLDPQHVAAFLESVAVHGPRCGPA
jgi:transcriptional antiterminator Rof (Rho-off)